MSRPFLVFFALLLVLRGWAGDAMAMQPPPEAACHGTHAMANGVDGHMAHAAPGYAHSAEQDCGGAAAQHAGCGDCQMCHVAGLPAGAARLTLALAPQAVPLGAPVAYASADPAAAFKPPIFRSPRP